jgi:hypothetical protein
MGFGNEDDRSYNPNFVRGGSRGGPITRWQQEAAILEKEITESAVRRISEIFTPRLFEGIYTIAYH